MSALPRIIASRWHEQVVWGRTGALRSRPPARPTSLARDQIRSILRDEHGDIWLATRGGLGWIPLESPSDTTWFTMGSTAAGDLPNEWVLSLYEDRHGVLWVGTWEGLARRSPFFRGIRWLAKPSIAGREPLGGIIAIQPLDAEQLLIGGLGGRLARVSVTGRTPGAYVSTPASLGDVYSLSLAENGDLWVATNGSGIQRRVDGRWRAYREGLEGAGGAPDDRVASIKVDRGEWSGQERS